MARRPYAPRTAAAFAVVTVALLAAGALLYDVIALRTGHPARRWQARLVHQLAVRQLDDPWVLTVAGLAVLAGVLLLWLAVTPGLRHWLPLQRPGAVIDRAGVAALIEARAGELPGVDAVAVQVHRRRAKVIITGGADPADVERKLRIALADLRLARPPRLGVWTRSPRQGPPPHGGGLAQESGR